MTMKAQIQALAAQATSIGAGDVAGFLNQAVGACDTYVQGQQAALAGHVDEAGAAILANIQAVG